MRRTLQRLALAALLALPTSARPAAAAFAFARADAALQPAQAPRPAASGTPESLDAQSLLRAATEAAGEVERAKARVDALQRRMSAASGRERFVVRQQLAEAQEQLQLAQTGSGDTGDRALLGQIDELQRSVPDVAAPPPASPPAGAATTTRSAVPTGIAALTNDLLSLGRKMRALSEAVKLTSPVTPEIWTRSPTRIRFPVPLENAAAVEDQIARALLEAIDREPRLKLIGSGTPTIQAVPEPAHA